MALPTSTIVMAVLTAVPFGLAIKDTVTGTSSFDTRSAEERDADEASATMERAQNEYEEQNQKKKVELRNAIEKMIPTEKAILVLPGYELGHEVPDPAPPEQERLAELAHAVFGPTQGSDGKMNWLSISFPKYHDEDEGDVCSLVSARLDEVWGTSTRTYSNGDTRKHFSAVKPQQRVTFIDPDYSSRSCSLVLEPYVKADELVNKTETSIVPLWALGKPAAKLLKTLGDDVIADETQISWTRPGLGEGINPTKLYAHIVKGKIVTVSASFRTSEESIGLLAEHLVAEYGESTETDPVVWTKAKLMLATLDESAGEYQLVAGEPLVGGGSSPGDE